MIVSTHHYTSTWSNPLNTAMDSKNTLIIVFADSNIDAITQPLQDITHGFPNSHIIGASTAGEILQQNLYEHSLVVAIIQFHSTQIKLHTLLTDGAKSSFFDGQTIAKSLLEDNLKAIFLLTDGLAINGSKLTKGLTSVIKGCAVVTGGLAADNANFKQTWIIVKGKPTYQAISAVGLYGNKLQVSHGSKGGWDSLGLERIVTKSDENILYELDHQPALDLYKKYLGNKADDLPASGLLFPLQLEEKATPGEYKVRTILAIDEQKKSITFAGDIDEGAKVTLMKANFDRLIDGAFNAAEQIHHPTNNSEDILSIAISCVGRKLVLKQRTEEELEATLEALPKNTKQIGFYAYGEISPLASGTCNLHNQTMTLTLLSEQDA